MPLKRNADEALADAPGGPKHAVVLRRTGNEVPMQEGRDLWWHELTEAESDDAESCPCEPMDAEDLLYLLYTSGTTAKPKGIAHTTAGYLVGVATTHHYIFDVKPDSVYWCAADVGWVTGHSYIVYGPSCNGTTGVMYEGVPDYPDRDRWWAIVERYGVDILYTAPTAIRSHMKWGREHADKHDLSSIRLLGSVGEPINPEAWVWYREVIGGDRVPVVDTWWQTETGMIMITPLPGVTTLKPGSATKPFPGVDAAVYDEQGNEVAPGGGGYLVLRKPWPAMLRGLYKEHDRYVETYWSKYADIVLRRRRRADRRGRRLLAAGPRGRRDERVRPPDLDDRGRVGARRPPERRGGRGLRARGRANGAGDRRVRLPEGRRRGLGRDARRAARPRGDRRSARSRSRRTSSSRPSSRRLAAARSCAACSGTSPRTGRSATRRRSPTRPSSRRSETARSQKLREE